jgi:histidine biosynthesis protein
MSRFILMLTRDDVTVSDALTLCELTADLDIAVVGCKDVGLPFDELRELVDMIHAQGRQAALEVVSVRREDELRSLAAGVELGVDLLLGGTHVEEALALLPAEGGPRYCPFPGEVVGHPSLLRGTVESITESARRLAAQPGVWGLDLLAHRFDGSAEQLVESVVEAVDVPVIAAGSVDSVERIRALSEAGVWGFTVGTAAFERRFDTYGSFRDQLVRVIEAAGPEGTPIPTKGEHE